MRVYKQVYVYACTRKYKQESPLEQTVQANVSKKNQPSAVLGRDQAYLHPFLSQLSVVRLKHDIKRSNHILSKRVPAVVRVARSECLLIYYVYSKYAKSYAKRCFSPFSF